MNLFSRMRSAAPERQKLEAEGVVGVCGERGGEAVGGLGGGVGVWVCGGGGREGELCMCTAWRCWSVGKCFIRERFFWTITPECTWLCHVFKCHTHTFPQAGCTSF